MIVFKYNKITSHLNEHSLMPSGGGSTTDPVSRKWVTRTGQVVDIDMVVTAVEAAIQDMALHYPSVESVIKHKDIIYTDDPRIDTMATDGVSIFVNPLFAMYLIENFDVVGLEYVLIHETLHVLFDHCFKLGSNLDKYSDLDKVNEAQDCEINFIIENFMKESSGLAPFKGLTEKIGGAINDKFGKKGLTWEEMYGQLPKKERKVVLEKTSDEWKKGFEEGYKEVMDQLRKQNLIESYAI